MLKKGCFFVLEGLDGSGTTTQAGLLQAWFAHGGKRFGKSIATFEPTPGPAGSLARLVLNKRLSLDKYTLALLFAADRSDHVHKQGDNAQEPGISHHLAQGIHVISDRYLLSSLAYQSLSLPMDWIFQINSQAISPDLTIYIDINPEIAQTRMDTSRHHKDLFEQLETQRQIRENYAMGIAFLQGRGHQIITIDGNRPQEIVHQDIITAMLPLLETSRHG